MKLFRYLTIMILGAVLYSCQEPMLVTPDDVERGVYVTFDPENTNINSGDIAGTPITGTFDVPADNVASHAINVQRIYDRGESESDFVHVETITEFPYEFSIDGDELAAMFGIPVEETFGNFYQFSCEATGTNGQVASWDNLHNDIVGSPEQLQGFRFRAAVVCPSDPEVIVGTYDAVTTALFPGFDPLVDFAYTVTISTTDEEGFYEISDFSFGTYDHLYGPWYGGGDLPGTIQDVCGIFFYTNTLDPWAETVSGDFTFNADGTITVECVTTFGEEWTTVMTKQ
ncbi:MAG: hypothetical protein ABFS38_20570 [Bacteroidota bacterium]